MDWYPRNPKDFDLGTLGWSLAERGAYSGLVDAYMFSGEPLPDDDVALAAILRVSLDDWLSVAQKVRVKFNAVDGLLRHERCDFELAKQANLAAKSRENGCKGGRPKRNENKVDKPSENQAGSQQGTQTKPQYNTRHNNKDSDTSVSESPERKAIEAYNAMAGETGLPQAQRLTDARRKHLKARLAECGGLQGWEHALGKIRGSPFLTGQNPRGWRADLDFILQQSSFTKIMEGRYDGQQERDDWGDLARA